MLQGLTGLGGVVLGLLCTVSVVLVLLGFLMMVAGIRRSSARRRARRLEAASDQAGAERSGPVDAPSTVAPRTDDAPTAPMPDVVVDGLPADAEDSWTDTTDAAAAIWPVPEDVPLILVGRNVEHIVAAGHDGLGADAMADEKFVTPLGTGVRGPAFLAELTPQRGLDPVWGHGGSGYVATRTTEGHQVVCFVARPAVCEVICEGAESFVQLLALVGPHLPKAIEGDADAFAAELTRWAAAWQKELVDGAPEGATYEPAAYTKLVDAFNLETRLDAQALAKALVAARDKYAAVSLWA